MATIDERYQEKLRARAEKRVPVFTNDPVIDATADSPEAVEARYQAKLERHKLAKPGQNENPAEPKGDAGEKRGKGAKADAPKGEGSKASPAEPKGDAGEKPAR